MEAFITIVYVIVLLLASRWWGRNVGKWEVDNKRTRLEGLTVLLVGQLVMIAVLYTIAGYAIGYYK